MTSPTVDMIMEILKGQRSCKNLVAEQVDELMERIKAAGEGMLAQELVETITHNINATAKELLMRHPDA